MHRWLRRSCRNPRRGRPGSKKSARTVSVFQMAHVCDAFRLRCEQALRATPRTAMTKRSGAPSLPASEREVDVRFLSTVTRDEITVTSDKCRVTGPPAEPEFSRKLVFLSLALVTCYYPLVT